MPLHKLQLENKQRRAIGQQNNNDNNTVIHRHRPRRVRNTNQIITQVDPAPSSSPPQFVPEPIVEPHPTSTARASVHRSRVGLKTAVMISLPVMLLLSMHVPSVSGASLPARNSGDPTGSSTPTPFEPKMNTLVPNITPQETTMMSTGSLPVESLVENMFPTLRVTNRANNGKGYCSSMRLNSKQVLTAKHCTEGQIVEVETSTGKRIKAISVKEHPDRDIAIVSLEAELPNSDHCSPPISTQNTSKTSLQNCGMGEGNYLLLGRGAKAVDSKVEDTRLEIKPFNEVQRDTTSKNQAYRRKLLGITQAMGATIEINAMQGDSGGPILQCNPNTQQLETVGVAHAVTYVEDDFDGVMSKAGKSVADNANDEGYGIQVDYYENADYSSGDYDAGDYEGSAEGSAANPETDPVAPILTDIGAKAFKRTMLEIEEVDSPTASWINHFSEPCNGIKLKLDKTEVKGASDADFTLESPTLGQPEFEQADQAAQPKHITQTEQTTTQLEQTAQTIQPEQPAPKQPEQPDPNWFEENKILISSAAVGATVLGVASAAVIAKKRQRKKNELEKPTNQNRCLYHS